MDEAGAAPANLSEPDLSRADLSRADERQADPSLPQLVTQLSEETSRLVRNEIRLAQAELQEKGKHAGLGVGLFGGAGVFAHLGLVTLAAAAILALALALPGWLAAAIVAAALFVIAAVAGLMGKKQVHQAAPKPERTVKNVKRDVQEVKERRQ
ncbi:MAG: phage holin family protein [Nocardioidaceae bacterium]